jgi:predicted cupin superfamily sugar epimerase
LESDETWHFYDGCSVTIHMINLNGDYSLIRLGKSHDENEVLQFTIPKNTWFAAAPDNSESFSLVGCSVYPGFDFEDFEMGNQNELLELFPQHQSLIKKFTKG